MYSRRRFGLVTAVLVLLLVILLSQEDDQYESPAKSARDNVLAMAVPDYAKKDEGRRLERPSAAPNILLILADDMGWRDVGYNKSEIRTPVIDRLASDGVTFNRFYVQPTCSPTRAALLTGRAPLRLGILDPMAKNNPRGLPVQEVTIAERLQGYGYTTALAGKWHLGARNLAYHPNERGFNDFYGHLTGAVGYFNKVHGGGYDWQRNGRTVREDGYTTHLLAKEVQRLIRQRDQTKPFFIYASFGAPHLPNEAPDGSIAVYHEIKDMRRRIHAAMVSELDRAMGDIEETLIAEGIVEDTLIWFMSDNGGLITEGPLQFVPNALIKIALEVRYGVEPDPRFVEFVKENARDGASDNRPFRGGKGSVYEGGVRVPAFLSWPGTLGSRVFDHMATVQDVAPTLVDLVGGSPPDDDFDGQSLVDSLLGNAAPAVVPYLVQTARLGEKTAVYRYPHKLIIEEGKPLALYELASDPLETTNLLHQEPTVAADLERFVRDFPRGPNISVSAQEAIQDPDYFGGVEDRAPWADQAYR